MSKKLRTICAMSMCLLAVGAFAAATSSSASTPPASARAACGIKGDERDFGRNMYLTALAVKGVSCHTGRQVVNQYSACRYSNGGLNGQCGGRVKGFKCNEGKRTVAPGIQYSVGVACQKGSTKVNFSYTQQI